eukprot:11554550-Karenia_brevis.AAC.1
MAPPATTKAGFRASASPPATTQACVVASWIAAVRSPPKTVALLLPQLAQCKSASQMCQPWRIALQVFVCSAMP